MKKKARPIKDDFPGWITHLRIELFKRAGINISDEERDLDRDLVDLKMDRLRWRVEMAISQMRCRVQMHSNMPQEYREETEKVLSDCHEAASDCFRKSVQVMLKSPIKKADIIRTELTAFLNATAKAGDQKMDNQMLVSSTLIELLGKGVWPKRSKVKKHLTDNGVDMARESLGGALVALGVNKYVKDKSGPESPHDRSS